MTSLPIAASFVPVDVSRTVFPSLSLTSRRGMTLWEWPSIKAVRPETFSMMSVERHGALYYATPQ